MEAEALLQKWAKGVGLVLGRWSALQLAVENGWGGDDARGKAEQLGELLIGFVHQEKGQLAHNEVEDYLEECLEEAFHLQVEDGSVGEVTAKLLQLYLELADGNDAGLARLEEAVEVKRRTPRVTHAPEPMEEADPAAGGEGGAAGAPTVDEDGWETVPVKRKGKRNR